MLQNAFLWAVGVVTVLVAMYTALQVSPWPYVLYYRHQSQLRQIINHGWFGMEKAAERHVLPGVIARLDEHYDGNDPDAVLDVFYPLEVENTDRKLPTIVWVHGGGFISGSKDPLANYLQGSSSEKLLGRWRQLLAGAG